jgi:short-subunit dehydrogenase
MYFNAKTIWITGASSGIGKALALELSKHKCNLILSARQLKKLNVVKSECADTSKVKIVKLDLEDYKQAPNVVEEALACFGKIDMLINNAGISQRSLIAETSIDVDKKLIDVNYIGTLALTKALLPYFTKQQSGHFVTVTSLMGKFGSPYRSGYCGAKHALHGFFDVLRMEHEKDNIKVTMICPGFVNTDVSRNALTGDGTTLNKQDTATEQGLSPEIFAKKMLKAVSKQKFEAYIGQKEIMGIFLKRFFPKLLHKVVLKSNVR